MYYLERGVQEDEVFVDHPSWIDEVHSTSRRGLISIHRTSAVFALIEGVDRLKLIMLRIIWTFFLALIQKVSVEHLQLKMNFINIPLLMEVIKTRDIIV